MANNTQKTNKNTSKVSVVRTEIVSAQDLRRNRPWNVQAKESSFATSSGNFRDVDLSNEGNRI